MDEYIKDVLDAKKMLIVERAVDEDLEADAELALAYETVADKFVDGEITEEDMEGCPFTEEEINLTIDDLIDEANEDELLLLNEPDTFPDDDGELAEINAALDSDIDPEILEFDDNEDLYTDVGVE